MAFCAKCGNSMSETAAFCTKCGTARALEPIAAAAAAAIAPKSPNIARNRKIAIGIVVAFVGIGIFAALLPDEDHTKAVVMSPQSSPSVSAEEADAQYRAKVVQEIGQYQESMEEFSKLASAPQV